jgi:uncharacterized protein YggU (UPF0235/DUF167 family)
VSGDPAFLRRTGTGVTVELRVQPRARRSALECVAGALKAQVTAPAEDGKANAAMVELLAETWHCRRARAARREDHGLGKGVCGERWLKRNL